MSLERRKLLKHLGAELVLTPGAEGMTGAINQAKEIVAANARAPSCPSSSPTRPTPRSTAAPPPRRSGRTPTARWTSWWPASAPAAPSPASAEVIKARKPSFKAIAVEPAASPVLSGGQPGPHKIQGIGAGFIPEILNTKIIDEIITVTNEEAFETARDVAKEEGILCGISSGAAVWAALQVARRPENRGKLIVVILPSTGERYLSTDLFAPA